MTPALCIDARMVGSSGIGTYLQGLLAGLERQPKEGLSYTLLGNQKSLPQGPWSIRGISSGIYSLREQWEVPRAFRQSGARLLHSPHFNIPWQMAPQTVVTVHDLIHLKFPEFWPNKMARAYASFVFRRMIPKTRAILTVSANTKRDLMEMLGIPNDHITVTPLGVDLPRFQRNDPAAESAFDRLALPRDYILYVGNLKRFKNVERLVEAYRLLKSRRGDCPALVLAGRNFIPGFERTLSACPGVHWIGEVARDILPALYRHALFFVFPSLYEGFGLPPLEAMAAGTPVLSSNRASLPEVVGDAAILIDPDNSEAMAAAMERLTTEDKLRSELILKGRLQAARFSWDYTVSRTLEVYSKCLS